MKKIGKLCVFSLNQIPFFIGISVGIALSLILAPFLEECALLRKTERLTNGREQEIGGEENFNDDYEPILNLHAKAKRTQLKAEKAQLIRPRYYSTELGIKERLFVGILTSSSSLRTLGTAVNRTLSTHVKKVFFLQDTESEKSKESFISVIRFIDKSVRLLFQALRYIGENFLNEYDFFLIAKDSTYIQGRKLQKFVSHISINEDVHCGVKWYADSSYCIVEAGILLSSRILKNVLKDMDWCLQHVANGDDNEIFGKCILHATHLPCESVIQGNEFSSQDISKYSSITLKTISWIKSIQNSLTIYPVQDENEHYQFHEYFCQQEYAINEQEIEWIKQQMINMSHFPIKEASKIAWPIGLEPSFKPNNRFDVIPWIYFNDSHIFLLDEFTTETLLTGIHKMDIDNAKDICLNWVRNLYNKKYTYEAMKYGYRRFDPTRGMEYIFHLAFKDKNKKTVSKVIEVVRPLSHAEIIPVPFVTEHTRIVLVLIVKSEDRKGAAVFLEDYDKTCLAKQENTILLVVFLYSPSDPGKGDVFSVLKNTINTKTNKYRSYGAKIAWLSIKTKSERPSDINVMDLIVRKLSPESMILTCKITMETHIEFLNRVRMNTILGTQVYFPIPFVQYHSVIAYRQIESPSTVEVKKELGYFDVHNFLYASFYVFDYHTARKMIEDEIPVARTDKDIQNQVNDLGYRLYDMFLKAKSLHVMRAVDSDLKIRFSEKECTENPLSTIGDHCSMSKTASLGTKSQLAAAILLEEERFNIRRNGSQD